MRLDATTGSELELDAQALGNVGGKIGLEADDLAGRIEEAERPVIRLGADGQHALLFDRLQHVRARARGEHHGQQQTGSQ